MPLWSSFLPSLSRLNGNCFNIIVGSILFVRCCAAAQTTATICFQPNLTLNAAALLFDKIFYQRSCLLIFVSVNLYFFKFVLCMCIFHFFVLCFWSAFAITLRLILSSESVQFNFRRFVHTGKSKKCAKPVKICNLNELCSSRCWRLRWELILNSKLFKSLYFEIWVWFVFFAIAYLQTRHNCVTVKTRQFYIFFQVQTKHIITKKT